MASDLSNSSLGSQALLANIICASPLWMLLWFWTPSDVRSLSPHYWQIALLALPAAVMPFIAARKESRWWLLTLLIPALPCLMLMRRL